MKVLVAIKRVPDGNVPLRLLPDGSGLDLAGMPMRINPFDEVALEAAVQAREAGKVTQIVAVCLGEASAQDALRHALAQGADRAVHLVTEQTLEPLTVAKLLRALVDEEQPDLVLLGRQASDEDNAQTAPMLAGLLGWPQGLFVSALDWQAPQLQVSCEIEGGQETLALSLPAVVSADLRLATPRYLKLPQLLQAKRKPIETHDAGRFGIDLSPRLRRQQLCPPPPRPAAVQVANVAALVAQLRTEGLA